MRNLSQNMGNMEGTALGLFGKTRQRKVSREIYEAEDLDSHVIVFGCTTNLRTFIAELRRPGICEMDFHPILGAFQITT